MHGNREDDFERNNAFSLYDLHGHTLAQEPQPRGHEIYNFGRPFVGHYCYILSLSNLCMGAEKKIFTEIMHFHYLTYMATP